MSTTNRSDQMWESLQDPDYRKKLIDEHVNVGIAFQIHGIRERQGLNQKKLAERLGDEKKQPLISAWENPNYGKYTLNTLKDLAKAFDVGLLVRFVPFSKMVEWTANLSHDVIAPPNFTEEKDGIDFFRQFSEMKETKDASDKFSNAIDEPIHYERELIMCASTGTSEGAIV